MTLWDVTGHGSLHPNTRALDHQGRHDPLGRFAHLLPECGLKVGILTDLSQRTLLREWLGRLSKSTIDLVLPPYSDPTGYASEGIRCHLAAGYLQVQERLRTVGPHDVIIDLRDRRDIVRARVWRSMFLDLRPGGLYIVDRRTARRPDPRLATWLDSLDARRSDDREYLDAVEDIAVNRQVVILTKRGVHLPKLTSAKVNGILPKRDGGVQLRLLSALDAGTFSPSSRDFSGAVGAAFGEDVTYPRIYLRCYAGDVVWSPPGLIMANYCVLPGSTGVDPASMTRNQPPQAGFVRVEEIQPTNEISGVAYSVDVPPGLDIARTVSEVASRLWGWDIAKARFPDLKAVYTSRGLEHDDLLIAMLTAYGIDPSEIVGVQECVKVEALISADAVWGDGADTFAHPEVKIPWHRISAGLADRSGPGSPPRHKRVLINPRASGQPESVIQLLQANGFAVIVPEECALPELAAVVRQAEVVAGRGMSAMTAFMPDCPQTYVVVGSDPLGHRRATIHAALAGEQFTISVTRPHLAKPIRHPSAMRQISWSWSAS
ncbi:hypothetical protein GCM10027613_39840 [Microlunatus endophyticus]